MRSTDATDATVATNAIDAVHAIDAPGETIRHDIEMVGRIGSVPTILQTVAHLTGMRFTAVARVTDDRWVACAVYDQIDFGLQPGGELVLESTICNEIRQHHQPVIFGQASGHPQYADHPTPRMYGSESYISIPIMLAEGQFFGTLCAIDPLPAKLDDPHVLATLELFARLIAAEIDTQVRLAATMGALREAQDSATEREHFIAVLGHDLRNPLMAIKLGVDVLQLKVNDARAQRTLDTIQASAERMRRLINDILDFARGRFGTGIPVAYHREDNLSDELRNVIAEVHQVHPGRALESSVEIAHPVACDAHRMAQLLANLLTNAMIHGGADQPVRVTARSDAQNFELMVSNGGQPIPRDKLARLFQPFTRAAADEARPGLGLGLYIAAEIARAHNGTLDVTSTDDETRFVFRMAVA